MQAAELQTFGTYNSTQAGASSSLLGSLDGPRGGDFVGTSPAWACLAAL